MLKNLFDTANIPLEEEFFEDMLHTSKFRLERIISKGHATPEDSWYDQEQNEWVLLLQGKAALRFEGTDVLSILCPGDYLLIPAHHRHRVEWTAADVETVWLALFY